MGVVATYPPPFWGVPHCFKAGTGLSWGSLGKGFKTNHQSGHWSVSSWVIILLKALGYQGYSLSKELAHFKYHLSLRVKRLHTQLPMPTAMEYDWPKKEGPCMYGTFR